MSNRFPTAQMPAELRLWEQSAWPEEDLIVEANRADLVGDSRWEEVDAVVSFRARRTQAAKGMDFRLLEALRAWFGPDLNRQTRADPC